MSTSAYTFTSSKHFDEFTYKLSQSMKSMKVSTLRESIAKSEGFSHVDAYRKKLDENKPSPLIQKTVTDPKLHECPDIYVENSKIVLSGLPVLGDWDEESASYNLTGDSSLLTPIIPEGESDFDLSSNNYSDLMVRGFINYIKDSQDNEIRCLKAIRNFYLGQGPEWKGREFANAVFYWIISDQWMMDSEIIQVLSDHLSEKNSSTEILERLSILGRTIQEDNSILGLSFDSISFGDKKSLTEQELLIRFSSILLTVFDYLKYCRLNPSDVSPETIKQGLQQHFYNNVPYLVLPALFAGVAIHSTNETIKTGFYQVEVASCQIMNAIGSHPEIWSMGAKPIEKALDDYYLGKPADLKESVKISGAAQYIANIIFGTTDQNDEAISTIESYIFTALITLEHLQTRNPVRHSFKWNPFSIYGSPDGGDPRQISPMIAYYAREMRNVLDLSVATGQVMGLE